MPTNGFSIEPLRVKLLPGEHPRTAARDVAGRAPSTGLASLAEVKERKQAVVGGVGRGLCSWVYLKIRCFPSKGLSSLVCLKIRSQKGAPTRSSPFESGLSFPLHTLQCVGLISP